MVGLTEEQETEAVDKSTLRLPGAQDELVHAVAAAARRTVVVVNAATPVLMPWLDEVDAVLWAGLPGQEGGHAVAAALLGDIEPAGRLVTTFPADDGAAPAWSVTPADGELAYAEGRSSATAATAPAAPRRRRSGSATAWATRNWDVPAVVDAPARQPTAPSGRGHGDQHRRPDQPRGRAGLPRSRPTPTSRSGWSAGAAVDGRAGRVRRRRGRHATRRLWRRWDTAADAWTTLDAGGRLLIARGLGDIRATLPLT